MRSWWQQDTPTSNLAAAVGVAAPTGPVEIVSAWSVDLEHLLTTTHLRYPRSPHTTHNGPADYTFGQFAVVPLVVATLAGQLDRNRACSLDDLVGDLTTARLGLASSYTPSDAANTEIRARKLVIDAAAETHAASLLAAATRGARYHLTSDMAGVDVVVRFAARQCSVQIKRGVCPPPSVAGRRFAVSCDEGEWFGPALVATPALVDAFVAATDIAWGTVTTNLFTPEDAS